MIGLSCTAGAVLALCGQVRGTLERKGLPQKELDGGRVRIEPRYNQGSGFGLVPLNGRQMAPLSLAALWALLGVCGGRGLGAGLLLGGGLSNLWERIRHGRVLDYLRFPKAPGPLKKCTYNLADLAIFLGAVLMVLRRRRQ